MGDFNKLVGKDRNNKSIGQHGENIINGNGIQIIELCNQFDLKVLNGFYPNKDIHKYTWTPPTRNLKSIIYYIIKQISDKKCNDFRIGKLLMDRDDFLVKRKMCIKFKSYNQQKGNNNKKWSQYSLERFHSLSIQVEILENSNPMRTWEIYYQNLLIEKRNEFQEIDNQLTLRGTVTKDHKTRRIGGSKENEKQLSTRSGKNPYRID